ncbi:hypothetical protein SDC9_64251 [bioreactor metagenome]|jgi:hypothetical protein|uniref:Lipoprotein n=1 Tax=bioreactor metagenome TaxID=1076179 RepID=A0A644XNS8_9ZZZZ
MKKFFLFLLFFSALFFTVVSCSKEESNNELSEQEQKEVILAMFNAGTKGVNQGMNNESGTGTKSTLRADFRSASYPVKYDGTYDYPDGKGGNIHLAINLGGVINYNLEPYQCLGGFILINIAETINHFRVPLTNGREVYLDTDQSVTFAGTFKLQPGCSTFDPSGSHFRIEGRYRCNGIEYDVLLLGSIKADGTCDSISGTVNGIILSFDF